MRYVNPLSLILLLITLVLGWLYFKVPDESVDQVNATTVLERMERVGKLELVKHHFNEIIELQRNSSQSIILRQLIGSSVNPDLKAVLISKGEAVACVDLTKLKIGDISVEENTLRIKIPKAELCYYKLDLDQTKLYDLESGFFVSKAEELEFIDLAYKKAESQMKQAALKSGILDQADQQARVFIENLLSATTDKNIVFEEVQVLDLLK